MKSSILSLGVRPDKNQNLGTQQLEFSFVGLEIDGEPQSVNLDSDHEMILEPANLFQLIKINKEFKECKIEFDIHLTGMDIQNSRYSSDSTIRDYGFNITSYGEKTGAALLQDYNDYTKLNKSEKYLDCYIGKATDAFITSGEYSQSEEFGDADLSGYSIHKLYENGASMYLKDAIMIRIHTYNIDAEMIMNMIANSMCKALDLDISDNYWTKDSKKVGGFFQDKENIFCFINTKEIPEDIKSLFICFFSIY